MRLEDFAGDICEECGRQYPARQYNQRFCSKRCRIRHRIRQINLKNRGQEPNWTCANCGTVYDIRPWNRWKYCSDRCSHEAQSVFGCQVDHETRRRARRGKTCSECGSRFDAPKKGFQKYCGPKCVRAARNRQQQARRHGITDHLFDAA